MQTRTAAIAALLLFAALPALAQGKSTMKPEDCARAENAQRSDCARMLGKTGDNARANKGGETRAGERADEAKELNAAKDKPAHGAMHREMHKGGKDKAGHDAHKAGKGAAGTADKSMKEKMMEDGHKGMGKKP